MRDLIGSFERLDEMYRLYIRSAFPLRWPALEDERDRAVMQDGVLRRPPLIEPLPRYQFSPYTIDGAEGALSREYAGLNALGSGIMGANTLFEHQWRSLRTVLEDERDIVVTTGTGSGKTECFLLPLFALLARESAAWPDAGPRTANWRWWDGNGKRVGQWAHFERPSAIRAVVLYPLNALVEDQLRRLRMALDTDDTHAWLNRERGGNRITFGRYTGQTPVSGATSKAATDRLRETLRRTERDYGAVRALADAEPALREMVCHYSRTDGAEMWSRWDMQETPPDILITNYSMLNIMLMRQVEAGMFDATRAWLAEPGHPERVFTLVVDELHSYRGTPGTEVAYVVRLLLDRLGLEPGSPKLRIMATTASLEPGDAGRRFLREFFGRDRFEFIDAPEQLPPEGARHALPAHAPALADYFERMATADSLPDAEAQREAAAAAREVAHALAGREDLRDALEAAGAVDGLVDAVRAVSGDGTLRAARADVLDLEVFPGQEPGRTVSRPLHGLLRALASAKGPSGALRPLRGHFFFQTLQGLWACIDPACAAVSEQRGDAVAPVGALHTSHQLTCRCGARVLDLHLCEVCGDVLLGGYRVRTELPQRPEFLVADQPDLEKAPERSDLDRTYEGYAVFWPTLDDDEPADPDWQHDGKRCSWRRAALDKQSGQLQSPPPARGDFVRGYVYHVSNADKRRTPCLPSALAARRTTGAELKGFLLRFDLTGQAFKRARRCSPQVFSGRCARTTEPSASWWCSRIAARMRRSSARAWNWTTTETWCG